MMRTSAGAVLLVSMLAYAAPNPPILPHSFAEWKETSAAPAASTSASAAAMQEYGLAQVVTAEYASGGNRLTVRAWEFHDATGAYGAFTFFLQPQMHAEMIGSGGAAEGGHFLLWHGETVIAANFSRPSGGDQAALNALAAELPRVGGGASVPPSLPNYLPKDGLDATSVRYAIGPAAYQQMGGELPAGMIGFNEEAEAVTAKYGPRQGTLTLILYPTPQIAASHLKAIDALARSSGLMTKRSGPLLAVVSRTDPRAKQLLGAVRFNDVVVMDRPEGYVNEAARVAQLLIGIASLTGILVLAALLVALFLGGGRALVRKIQGKPISSLSDEEFISLNLGR
ncbi:MAG TPA: DUF6599 family protein [Acidobacteriaceae bacterium]|nr:DUF6599 family protein [Acidobacteriaceae bacterium]